MIRTTCTCFLDGVKVCGKVDMCTRVEVRNLAGVILLARFACADCRRRMKLPEFDCYMDPTHPRGRRLKD